MVTTGGELLACGDNYYGQLGLGDKQSRLSPTELPATTTSLLANLNAFMRNSSHYCHTVYLSTKRYPTVRWAIHLRMLVGAGRARPPPEASSVDEDGVEEQKLGSATDGGGDTSTSQLARFLFTRKCLEHLFRRIVAFL